MYLFHPVEFVSYCYIHYILVILNYFLTVDLVQYGRHRSRVCHVISQHGAQIRNITKW